MTAEVQYLYALRRQLGRLVTTQKAIVKLQGMPNHYLALSIAEVRDQVRLAQLAAILSQSKVAA